MTFENNSIHSSNMRSLVRLLSKQCYSFGSSGFMGISTANSNQNPLGATVTALPCRQ
ncbi:MAG: hypothetical protein M1G31_16360 [Pseudanabaena sp. Salubria-1]|nr:hypothetical protein [Pseudanabaena sp. Salubria-1]